MGWMPALKGGTDPCAPLSGGAMARRTERLLFKPRGAAQKLSCCLVMAAACRGTKQNHLTSHSCPSLTASLFTVVWASRSHNF